VVKSKKKKRRKSTVDSSALCVDVGRLVGFGKSRLLLVVGWVLFLYLLLSIMGVNVG
jgi:hypothetical protein